MAEHNFPLLVFPAPAHIDRTPRYGFSTQPSSPDAREQGKRLTPQFQRLQDALAKQRITLQGSSLGIEPEQVLVLETVGRVENFIRAVAKIEGLEWLAEYELEDIEPGDGFEHIKHPENHLNGQIFLIMSDGRALKELQSLFKSWTKNPDAPFRYGLAPLKRTFKYLHTIRPWDVEDRIAETGLIADWNERIAFGHETVSFEAELWFRNSKLRRHSAAEQIRQLVDNLNGQIVSECVIHDIAYHAILGKIDISHVQGLLDRPETRREIVLLKCDDIMFMRPVGQCAVPINKDADEVSPMLPPDLGQRTEGVPAIALLDGMPLTGHILLNGRLIVDDPDQYEDRYLSSERSHGTAMASLICHGDLNSQNTSIGRPIYVRPIMQPQRWPNGQFMEMMPQDVLLVDLIHRAVVRIFDGEGDELPASPEVRVINISICDSNRPFIREMSGCARLLDWLSWKYSVLFVVSAGNHLNSLHLELSAAKLRKLEVADLQRLIISTVTQDTRNRRLLSPAETLNGLTVGAIHADDSTPNLRNLIDPLKTGLPSIISAHGPGYRKSIKPEIHLPGGRQLLSEKSATTETVDLQLNNSRRAPGQCVATPGRTGSLNSTQHTCGTSNAAALASREAGIFYELLMKLRAHPEEGLAIPEKFDTVLIKALLVHGSGWTGMVEYYRDALNCAPQKFREYVTRFLGYGRPDFAKVAMGDNQRVTMLGFGSLSDGQAAEFALPLPPELSGQNLKRRVIVTLAWFSPINSRRQKYRVAHLWFELSGTKIADERLYAKYQSVVRGTIQHEVFESQGASAFQDGDKMIVKVNCRKDANNLDQPVRFGLVVTLEIVEDTLFPISIYQSVKDRLYVRVPATIDAV